MKFSTAILATGLLASSVLAVPAASAEPGLVRAGNFGKWCIAPGQMCYKSKRDLDDAKTLVSVGFEAPHPDSLERRGLVRAGKFGKWCIGPGQMCYKSKRDYDEAVTDVAANYDAPHPDSIEKRGLVRAGNFGKWCIAPGQMCYKTRRDLDEAKDAVLSGYEAPTPEALAKRDALPGRKALVRAGYFGKWCIAPGQMCYKNKRDLDDAKTYISAGDYAPLPAYYEWTDIPDAPVESSTSTAAAAAA